MAGARPDTWMPIYWGDYAKDTGHLSAAHHGAYLMLIKHYWVTGQPLPNDDSQLWRIACADSLAHWRKIKPVVLAFFEVRDGQLHHGRVEKEMVSAGHNAERRAESARRASAARWRNEAGGNPPRNAARMRDGSTQPGEGALTSTAADKKSTSGKISPEDAQGFANIRNPDAGRNASRMPDAMPGHSPPPSPSQYDFRETPLKGSLSEAVETPPPVAAREQPLGAAHDSAQVGQVVENLAERMRAR